jgi:hypothetical protein
MLRTTTIVLAMSLPITAQAECYVRSAVTNQTAMNVTSIADVEPLVVPISATQNKCIVMFRAQVNGKWITAEGEKIGPKTPSTLPLGQAVPRDGTEWCDPEGPRQVQRHLLGPQDRSIGDADQC